MAHSSESIARKQAWAIACVVGERTAGAFLAGKPIPLSDGSLLYLATDKVQVDGVTLEGKGVAPDIAVASGAGADPQRERALEVAAELAAKHAPRAD